MSEGAIRKAWWVIRDVGAICGIVAVLMAVALLQARTGDLESERVNDVQQQEQINQAFYDGQVNACEFGNDSRQAQRELHPEIQRAVVEVLAVELEVTPEEVTLLSDLAANEASRVAVEKLIDRPCDEIPKPTTTEAP